MPYTEEMLDTMHDLIRLRLLAVPVVTATLACTTSAASSDDLRRVTPFTVVALGDSLTAGPGLQASQTWPSLLQDRMRRDGYPGI